MEFQMEAMAEAAADEREVSRVARFFKKQVGEFIF